MIGIFDSGVGGFTAMREVRRLMPAADICYLADIKNSPYGTKSTSELISLVENDIQRLCERGASRILIACSTASTVYPHLSEKSRDICFPIIKPTARRALEVSKSKRIGVLATKRTVAEHAFKNEIEKISKCAYVYETEAQSLVGLVEEGECDGYASKRAKEEIKKVLKPIIAEDLDTLVLGCTHFPHLEKTISHFLRNVNIISCSCEGARNMCETIFEMGHRSTEFIF